jgi:DNA-binding response OmpR family regulator
MKILIAEDDPASCKVLRITLEKLGHSVIAAENGRQALQICSTEEVPLLISDWMMPEMDGLELCRTIRERTQGRYTYIILLSALGGKQNYLEGMEAGADDFITKPFDQDQLIARLRVAERILGLQAEVQKLHELLPLCAWCKKIQNSQEQWVQFEAYVAQQMGKDISHSICPDCLDAKLKQRHAD